MRVLLADENQHIRSALRVFFSLEPGIQVVAEAGATGDLATLISNADPQVLLVSWELLCPNPDATLATLLDRWPHLTVVIMSGRPEQCREALDAGAHAFVYKADPPESLRIALANAYREANRPSANRSASKSESLPAD